tara:strand:+ start:1727 stop:2899 length:1173 start_codon:yes stop_codon:yes gene_type:complete
MEPSSPEIFYHNRIRNNKCRDNRAIQPVNQSQAAIPPMPNRSLGDLLESRQNSFNAVRLLASAAVFVSHSFLLLPFGAHLEPFDGATYNLGQIAVNVFFCPSGLMLSRSYALNRNPARFAWARTVRIFPGLIAASMVTAWIIGPLNTTLPLGDYFAAPETLAYPFSVPLLFNAAPLPGVFAFGVEPFSISTPLWTIKYELLAYIGFTGFAATGLWPRGRGALIVTPALGIALTVTTFNHALDENIAGSLLRFGFCFALGHLAFIYRDVIRLDMRGALAGLGLGLPLLFTPLGALVSIVSVGYLAVCLGNISFGRLTCWSRRTDISYGIYLYAWPIQQMLIGRFAHDAFDAMGLALLAAAIAVAMGWLSWTLIERPALSLKLRENILVAAN